MNTWPLDTREELDRFYGRHELGPDGMPTDRWEDANLVWLPTPFPMRLAWQPKRTVMSVRCHRLVAESLGRVLSNILAVFGSPKAVWAAHLDLYGGCYNYRVRRGLTRLSVHAWGAAIDLDPARNPLGLAYSESAGMVAHRAVELFELEGWQWGGRWRRPDCMHFQATGPSIPPNQPSSP
ncbi:MAG: M15 family metallopeptidase [Verrucomicrobia bacterium]|nr:M15 family metallopeptidase [Verrucomicrobiota bacterium]